MKDYEREEYLRDLVDYFATVIKLLKKDIQKMEKSKAKELLARLSQSKFLPKCISEKIIDYGAKQAYKAYGKQGEIERLQRDREQLKDIIQDNRINSPGILKLSAEESRSFATFATSGRNTLFEMPKEDDESPLAQLIRLHQLEQAETNSAPTQYVRRYKDGKPTKK